MGPTFQRQAEGKEIELNTHLISSTHRVAELYGNKDQASQRVSQHGTAASSKNESLLWLCILASGNSANSALRVVQTVGYSLKTAKAIKTHAMAFASTIRQATVWDSAGACFEWHRPHV